MTYDDYLKHAWKLYYQGVDADGSQRRHYLQQAKQVLANVPSGYRDRDDLMNRIDTML